MTQTALDKARQNYLDEVERDQKIKAAQSKAENANKKVKSLNIRLIDAVKKEVEKRKD